MKYKATVLLDNGKTKTKTFYASCYEAAEVEIECYFSGIKEVINIKAV